MKTIDLLNGVGIAAALGLGITLAVVAIPPEPDQPIVKLVQAASIKPEMIDGVAGLRDASGRFVPLRRYERILSLSSVTDGLVQALVSPERVAAYSPYAKHNHFAFRYEGRPQLTLNFNVETLLSMAPDLVIANHLSRPDQVAQLRDAGLFVFDLGEMKGLDTLLPNITTAALLLGEPQRGAALAKRLALRLQRLADHIPADARPEAIYIGIHGDKIYGGAQGTSYHDVLEAAGLTDIASDHYEGWPRYTSEQLLQLDPEVLVTQENMGRTVCRHPGLSELKACGHGGRIIELQSSLLLSPGLEMLDAAEALHFHVHPESSRP